MHACITLFKFILQAAGLKHVEVINGDEGFYPEPMKDFGTYYTFQDLVAAL